MVADDVMQSLLKMLESSGDSNGVQEDALLAVGTLTEVVGDKFMNYFDAFKQFLVKGLQNKAEYQVRGGLVYFLIFKITFLNRLVNITLLF